MKRILVYYELFFCNLSRKYCCDATISETKTAHFGSVHFDQKPAMYSLSTANAKDFNTDDYIENSP